MIPVESERHATTRIDNEKAALLREEIFACAGAISIRGEAVQRLAYLGDDGALDFALRALIQDMKFLLFARQQIEHIRLGKEAA